MRLFQIVLPKRHRDELDVLLGETNPDHRWRTNLSDDFELTTLLVRTAEVEHLADALTEQFSIVDRFRIVLLPVEATRPRLPEPAPKKTAEKEIPKGDPASLDADAGELAAAGKKRKIGRLRISRDELHEDIAHAARPGGLFAMMVVLSTVVAAVGLLRDSAAVIIGAMVIAPLLGPNMALALGTTLGDRPLIRQSLLTNAIGVGLALAMSTLTGVVLPPLGAPISIDPDTATELMARTDVQLTDVLLALASGAAGALAFTSGAPATLVGVMVAVAMLPPTTTAGLLLGSSVYDAKRLGLALNAAMLLLVNVVSVNLAATLTFLIQGVRPDTWWEAKRAKSATNRAVIIWSALLIALILLLVLEA